MKKTILYSFLLISLLISCINHREKNHEFLERSESKVKIFVDSIIKKDIGTWFFILSQSKQSKIIAAYFDCQTNDKMSIDSLNQKIKNCDKNLMVVNDTVKIYLEPNQVGLNKFRDVTLLLKDNELNYSYIDTTFYYEVR